MNMSKGQFAKPVSRIFAVLGNPFRVRLALALGEQEACVCHLEQMLKKRQAYISQHLMVLREADLLETRRDGKYIYYRLASPAVLDLVSAAAAIAGVETVTITASSSQLPQAECECPKCCQEN